MFASTVRQAIEAVCPSHLDDISRTIWRAHAADLLTAEDAQELAEAVEARRALRKASQGAPRPEQRRVGSRPKSSASLERRRRWVASGLLPPDVAASFTAGEAAALSVVALEIQNRGRCELVISAIAALAGVSVSTVKNALREARRLGLISVTERRLSWNRNLPNIVRIVCLTWSTWLRMGARKGGGKFVAPTPTDSYKKRFAPLEKASNKVSGRLLGPLARSKLNRGTN